MTRAEFEQLSSALQSDLSPTQRLSIAYAYAKNLRMAAAAEQRGIDKTARFEAQMRYARLQLLAQDLNQTLQQEANQISDADINTRYHANQPAFEEAVFERVIVPYAGKSPTAGVMVMAELADAVRIRLLHGESSDQLQREIFAQSQTPYTSVNTRIEKVRRSSLPPNQEQVMTLAPGQVSAVLSDPEGAHFIYRMVSKRLPEVAEVRDEIIKLISTESYRDSIREFQGNTEFSDNYFNPPANQTGSVGQHGKQARKITASDQK